MTVAGLVLAAGGGRRFGAPKATVELDGERLVDRAVRILRDGGCRPVCAVLGAAVVEVPGADAVVVNPGWATGLGSSLAAGLAAPGLSGADAVVVTLADQPWLAPAAIRWVVAAAGPARAAALVVATYDGRRSHPVLLGRDHWAGVRELAAGDQGARPYLKAHHELVVEVPCDGAGHPTDVDHPSDLHPPDSRNSCP
jgi:CTP:molybdopterin cytidylyltransferase MocA